MLLLRWPCQQASAFFCVLQNNDAQCQCILQGLEDSITAMLAAGLAADAESILAAKKLVDSLRNGSGSPSNRAQLQREARKAVCSVGFAYCLCSAGLLFLR